MAAETVVGGQRISRRIFIEPLDPQRHNRAAFSCGTIRLDNFLKRTARKHQAGDFTRVWVATDVGNVEILGYYALNAHALEGNDLPTDLTKKAPRFGSIPGVYLSMIAVDCRHQGRGLGRILLADALTRAAAVSDQIGLKAVVLDMIDDGGPKIMERRRTFHAAMGFRSVPSRPARMFISIETVRNSRA